MYHSHTPIRRRERHPTFCRLFSTTLRSRFRSRSCFSILKKMSMRVNHFSSVQYHNTHDNPVKNRGRYCSCIQFSYFPAENRWIYRTEKVGLCVKSESVFCMNSRGECDGNMEETDGSRGE